MAHEAEFLDAVRRGDAQIFSGQTEALKEVWYAGSCLQALWGEESNR
jgi:hypothetical protein